MKRTLYLLLGILLADNTAPKKPTVNELECKSIVSVDEGKVKVRVPCFDRQQLVQIVTMFFAKSDPEDLKNLDKVLTDSKNITLIVTTEDNKKIFTDTSSSTSDKK